MSRHQPFRCTLCGQTWPRDPAVEVPCPTCHAPIGRNCRRPSGHPIPGDKIHPGRDHLAMATVPGYGRCPKAPAPAAERSTQGDLFRRKAS